MSRRSPPGAGFTLGKLADARKFTAPIRTRGFCESVLFDFLRQMIRIRKAEEKIGAMVASGEVRCPCHLTTGQEAVAVGVAHVLRPSDRAFGGHRSHGHYLALGGSSYRLFAEVLGRADGCSGGMGGSMHLFAPENGLRGTVPIVAATIPVAAGAALAAQMDGSDDIAVSFFGDGATEEGVFHETLNLAAIRKLPLLFVCENNLFSSHLHINLRQKFDSVSRFARAQGVPSAVVDGNDVALVARTAEKMTADIRRGGGPGFLEAVTYRWCGHVGPREDLDVGVKRKDDLAKWKRRDPVERLFLTLQKTGALTRLEWEGEMKRIDAALERELEAARHAEPPKPESLLEFVYEKS